MYGVMSRLQNEMEGEHGRAASYNDSVGHVKREFGEVPEMSTQNAYTV